MMQSLEVAEKVADNRVMDTIIEGLRSHVSGGGGLRDPISSNPIFPPMVAQMVAIGEESGTLGESLEKSSNYLDREIDEMVKRLIARVEPAVTIVIAAIVGLLMLAIYLPMFDIIKGASA